MTEVGACDKGDKRRAEERLMGMTDKRQVEGEKKDARIAGLGEWDRVRVKTLNYSIGGSKRWCVVAWMTECVCVCVPIGLEVDIENWLR